MKTVRFHATGGPEVLALEETPDPVPGEGEVLIRVDAVGLNFADVMRRRGDNYPEKTPLPFTLGGEIAGTITALGQGVNGLSVGTSVFAAIGQGGYAQLVTVPAARVIPIPPGIDAAQATTLIVQGLTAFLTLRESARLQPGESVLVEAAAGGVGGFAIQLAKIFGAGRVIAAAGSPQKRGAALALGADVAVDYSRKGWAAEVLAETEGRGADVILEMTGGVVLDEALDALAPFGRMIVYGLASGEVSPVDTQRLIAPNQTISGFYIGSYFARPDLIGAAIGEIIGHVLAGRLSLRVDRALPLSAAVEAHRLLETRATTGKVVLLPWS